MPDKVEHSAAAMRPIDDTRNLAGRYMLAHGVKMGVAVDPADVQDLVEGFAREHHDYLIEREKHWQKLAEDALNVAPPKPILIDRELLPEREAAERMREALQECEKVLRTVSGQLSFVIEYVADAVYGTDETRKTASDACSRIAKEGHATWRKLKAALKAYEESRR